MPEIIHTPADSGNNPRNRSRGEVRSFTWEPQNGDEITACSDCRFWHAQITFDRDEYGVDGLLVREWHESNCPCWTVDA